MDKGNHKEPRIVPSSLSSSSSSLSYSSSLHNLHIDHHHESSNTNYKVNTPIIINKLNDKDTDNQPVVIDENNTSVAVVYTDNDNVRTKARRIKGNPVQMISIIDNDLRETFIKGRGPGGQKINKTNNCVQLLHIPTGIIINCQETRDLQSNRKIARKMLRDKLDLLVNGDQSKLGKKYDKIRKQKQQLIK